MADNRRDDANGITVLDRLDRSVIFSISADAGTLASWRAYIEAKAVGTAETVITAMAEYMARNPLTPQEMETYNELMSDLSWSKSWASWRTWKLRHGSGRGAAKGKR